MDPATWLPFLHQLADRADEIALRFFRANGLRVEEKPDSSPVTEADRAIQGNPLDVRPVCLGPLELLDADPDRPPARRASARSVDVWRRRGSKPNEWERAMRA